MSRSKDYSGSNKTPEHRKMMMFRTGGGPQPSIRLNAEFRNHLDKSDSSASPLSKPRVLKVDLFGRREKASTSALNIGKPARMIKKVSEIRKWFGNADEANAKTSAIPRLSFEKYKTPPAKMEKSFSTPKSASPSIDKRVSKSKSTAVSDNKSKKHKTRKSAKPSRASSKHSRSIQKSTSAQQMGRTKSTPRKHVSVTKKTKVNALSHPKKTQTFATTIQPLAIQNQPAVKSANLDDIAVLEKSLDLVFAEEDKIDSKVLASQAAAEDQASSSPSPVVKITDQESFPPPAKAKVQVPQESAILKEGGIARVLTTIKKSLKLIRPPDLRGNSAEYKAAPTTSMAAASPNQKESPLVMQKVTPFEFERLEPNMLTKENESLVVSISEASRVIEKSLSAEKPNLPMTEAHPPQSFRSALATEQNRLGKAVASSEPPIRKADPAALIEGQGKAETPQAVLAAVRAEAPQTKPSTPLPVPIPAEAEAKTESVSGNQRLAIEFAEISDTILGPAANRAEVEKFNQGHRVANQKIESPILTERTQAAKVLEKLAAQVFNELEKPECIELDTKAEIQQKAFPVMTDFELEIPISDKIEEKDASALKDNVKKEEISDEIAAGHAESTWPFFTPLVRPPEQAESTDLISPEPLMSEEFEENQGDDILYRGEIDEPKFEPTSNSESGAIRHWSTDVDIALRELIGDLAKQSWMGIEKMTAVWKEGYEDYFASSLSDKRYPYLWVDAHQLNLPDKGWQVTYLSIIGVDCSGRRKLLSLIEGNPTEPGIWRNLLENLEERGLGNPRLFIGDSNLSLWQELPAVFPRAKWQGCWQGFRDRLMAELSSSKQKDAAAMLDEIHRARSYEQASGLLEHLKNEFGSNAPRAIAELMKNKRNFLTYFNYPFRHWDQIRDAHQIKNAYPIDALLTTAFKYEKFQDLSLYLTFYHLLHTHRNWHRMGDYGLLRKVQLGNKFNNGGLKAPSSKPRTSKPETGPQGGSSVSRLIRRIETFFATPSRVKPPANPPKAKEVQARVTSPPRLMVKSAPGTVEKTGQAKRFDLGLTKAWESPSRLQSAQTTGAPKTGQDMSTPRRVNVVRPELSKANVRTVSGLELEFIEDINTEKRQLQHEREP